MNNLSWYCIIQLSLEVLYKFQIYMASNETNFSSSSGAKAATGAHRRTCKVFAEDIRTTEGKEFLISYDKFNRKRAFWIYRGRETWDASGHFFSSNAKLKRNQILFPQKKKKKSDTDMEWLTSHKWITKKKSKASGWSWEGATMFIAVMNSWICWLTKHFPSLTL